MKSGTILLIGPTNSGKSTLLNKIIGKRVSLVSRKKQSTTFNQKAIKSISEAEIILQDTPGIFSSNFEDETCRSVWFPVACERSLVRSYAVIA